MLDIGMCSCNRKVILVFCFEALFLLVVALVAALRQWQEFSLSWFSVQCAPQLTVRGLLPLARTQLLCKFKASGEETTSAAGQAAPHQPPRRLLMPRPRNRRPCGSRNESRSQGKDEESTSEYSSAPAPGWGGSLAGDSAMAWSRKWISFSKFCTMTRPAQFLAKFANRHVYWQCR